MQTTPIRSLLMVGPVAACALASIAALPQEPTGAAPPPAAYTVEDCKTCHEQAVTVFETTAHVRLENSCSSCHEGVVDHMQAQMEGKEQPGPSLKNLKPSELSDLCLGCHEKKNHNNWVGGVHDRRGVSCVSCHSVHSFKSLRAQLKTPSAADTCYSCHAVIRAKSLRTSHHPVREGVMDCGSCHDPHDGSRPKMIRADWTNELCFSCHTEKRGPFLWEHAPVRESCLNCHDPHGSNHDKMLVAKQPYLCQRCHLNTRHPGTLYDGSNAATVAANATNRAVEHACKNCHQNVHGSNAPSGPYLGR
jgi:DmsE family decaheme c-type cytochrome